MTYTFWSSNTGGGPTPPPHPIGQSLRFRGAQNLTRTFAANGSGTRTVSFWMKKSVTAASVTHLITGGSLWSIELDTANGDMNARPNGIGFYDGTSHAMGLGSYRDPSAWYHVVATTQSTTARMWVNGELMYTTPGRNERLFNLVTIGSYSDNTFWFEGYLADVYFIDGQALLPTAFGRYNDNGVWVPREVDFTPATMRYSDLITAVSGTFNPATSAENPANLFNGNISGVAPATFRMDTGNQNGSMWRFTPSADNPITVVNEVTTFPLQTAAYTFRASVDGVVTERTDGVAGPNGTPYTLTTGPGNLDWIEYGLANFASCMGIAIDGEMLTNPFIWSADLTALAGRDFFTPENAFNGVLTDGAVCGGGTPPAQLTFAPRAAIPVTTLDIRTGSNNINVDFGGQTTNLTGGNGVWQNVPNLGTATQISATTPLVLTRDNVSGSSLNLQAIRVNGQILINGVNNSYGPNGFHLTFENPDDLGLDTSGNGNDFTANGFNTDVTYNGDYNWSSTYVDSNTNTIPTALNDTPYWIDLVPNASGTDANKWCSGNGYYNWSNGKVTGPGNDNGTYIYGSGQLFQDEMTFDLRDFDTVHSAAIWGGWNQADGGSSSAMIYLLDENKNIIPGTTVHPVRVGDYSTRVEMCKTDVGARYIKFDLSAPGSFFFLYGIEINGGLITQNVSNSDYDIMQDGPGQNYATLNPLVATGGTVADANLSLTAQTGNVWEAKPSTLHVSKGKWYWEVTAETVGQCVLGIGRSDGPNAFDANKTDMYPGQSGAGESIGLQDNGNLRSDGTQEGGYSISYSNGSVLSFALDMDSGTLWIAVNGGWQGGATQAEIEAGITTNSARTGMQGTWRPVEAVVSVASIAANHGQQPFLFTPPTGFERLQTANLPAATIANGRDHFRAITGPGADILTDAQAVFPNGLWWIKDRVNSNQHQLVDSIDGATSCRQLNAGTTGAYVAPAGDSVAWCWNWDQADPQANGFSIVEFNASGDTTIDTGLANPEFLFYYSTISAKTFVGFRLLGNGFLELNEPQQFVSGSTIQWQTGANAGEVIFDGARIGGAGKLFAWHSVPGYSAFGSYTGNAPGDGNGVFIYTGFKPAFVMCKRTDSNGDWVIMDTTRDVNNPANQWLEANSANGESAPAIGPMDILSNGFKHRGASNQLNTNGDYVYAAFAENPFQAPVTAR